MLIQSFDIYVSYSQISVFNSKLENPFNEWNEKHIKQGFSWREGSVSFATFFSSFANVKVNLEEQLTKGDRNGISILVPFEVFDNNNVEIATIEKSHIISLEKGMYGLLYECSITDNEKLDCSFTFFQSNLINAKIINNGNYLSPEYPLLMYAQPA